MSYYSINRFTSLFFSVANNARVLYLDNTLKREKGSYCHSSTHCWGKTLKSGPALPIRTCILTYFQPCLGELWEKWEEHYRLASVITLFWPLRRQWLLSLYKDLRWKVSVVLCGGGTPVLGIPLEAEEVMGKELHSFVYGGNLYSTRCIERPSETIASLSRSRQ